MSAPVNPGPAAGTDHARVGPTPFDEPADPASRRRRALLVGGVAAAALLVAVAAFAGVSAASSGSTGYRTAVVSSQEVERSLLAVGTIRPVAQAAVAFPVSGTVATVDVVPGSVVVPGQVLATLDGTQLERAVTTKQAALDQAELNLSKVLSGESTGTGGSGASSGSARSTGASAATTGGTATSGGTASATSTAPATSGDGGGLSAARTAVADAQHTLDADLAAAQGALEAATAACPDGSSGSTTTSTTSTTVPGGDASTACQQALAAALTAQQKVAAYEKALQQAVNALDRLLSSSGGSGSAGSTSGSTSGSTGGSSGGSTGSGGTGSTSSVSSADIVAAQKSVDAAAAQLAVAQQALAQATIVSPIAGTVTATGLTVGESVSAGSSTATILVAGPGGFEVTTAVAVTDLPHVSVGQSATVVPDGSTAALAATVVQIGLVPASSSTTATTYPVVLALADPSVTLPDGGLATVRIVTGSTVAATAVPTSAVTTTATSRTVVVLEGGSPKTVTVQVGTVGSTWTEITSGLTVGQTVVLADLSLPLPGSATSGSSTSAGTRTATSTAGGFTPPAGFAPPGG